MSEPSMQAYYLELLSSKLIPGSKILNVDSESGYMCAAFYELVKSDEKGT